MILSVLRNGSGQNRIYKNGGNCYDSITCYAREECGFAGYVMTDWFTSNARISSALSKPNPVYPCSSSPLCVYAGNDVQMPGGEGNIPDIITAVNDGKGVGMPIHFLWKDIGGAANSIHVHCEFPNNRTSYRAFPVRRTEAAFHPGQYHFLC